MTEQTKDLIVSINPDSALAVFSQPNGLDPYLDQIRAEVNAFVPDMTTDTGRKAIASVAYKVAKSKTYLDGLGKSLTDEWAKKKKVVDEERRRVRDELDALKDQVRAPLTAWEQAEKERVERLSGIVAYLDSAKTPYHEDGRRMNSEEIGSVIAGVTGVFVDASFGEFEQAAINAKAATLEALNAHKAEAEKQEAEALELERLRKEQAEREQREREERIAKEAADKARAEAAEEAARKEAAQKAENERRAQEAEQQRLRAEQEKQEAERRHAAEIESAKRQAEQAAEDERKRIEQHQAAEKAAEDARQKDRAHQKAVHADIISDMAAIGVDEETAKRIITAIRKGQISNLKVFY
jgi:hypothetical protein